MIMEILLDFNFGLKGDDYKVEPKKLAKLLNCDCDGILNTSTNFVSNVVWCQLERREEYDSHITKLMGFHSLIVRILHQITSYILNARKNINRHVTA